MSTTNTRNTPATAAGPKDCVQIHRSVGGVIELVGYDAEGVVQIEVRMHPDRMTPRWEGWLLRWLRGWPRDRPRLMD